MPQQPSYNQLLEIPLFQGMSRGDINTVVKSTRFNFYNIGKDRTVVKEGAPCTGLGFLTKGTLCAVSMPDDRSYVLEEYLPAPALLQPECLFGLTQRHTKTFRTATDCELLFINKQEAMKMSDNFDIFRLNLLNILCTMTQKTARQPWRKHPQEIRGKIVRFVERRCIKPVGRKTLRIKMEQLGHEIGESRLNVSRELNAMHAEGVITLRRSEIVFPAFERLLM